MTWPVVLITVGALFLAGQYSRYGFFDLWPVILIVIGALMVIQAMVSREGHVGT
ncbi:MAG: LiaI-LiaF-like domain-containing protein [Candidatus Acidiferrales bacterium]